MFVDPQWKEESVMKGRITMILNIHKEICGVQKAGGIPLAMQQILRATKIAMVKVKELTAVIKEALKKDLILRGKEKVIGHGDRLMTSGIGTHQEDDGSIKFCDGMKSVSVQNENIEKHVPPSFSSEAAKDVDEFIAKFGLPSNLNNQEDNNQEDEQAENEGNNDDEGDNEDEDEGEGDEGNEEEEETMLLTDEWQAKKE